MKAAIQMVVLNMFASAADAALHRAIRVHRPRFPNISRNSRRSSGSKTDGWKVAEPKDDLVRSNWWEMLGDSQLNALEEQAGASNQVVAAASPIFSPRAPWFKQAPLAILPHGWRESIGNAFRGSPHRSRRNTPSRLPNIRSPWMPHGNFDFWGRVP
jgi:hypothetical protein